MTLGAPIRTNRERLGISQRELARRIGKSAQYVNDMERDRRTPEKDETLLALATALEMNADLLCWSIGRLPPDTRGATDTATIRAAWRAMRDRLGDNDAT